MMRLTAVLLLLAPQAGAAASFAQLRADFVGKVTALRPETATSLGLTGHNGKLLPPTPQNIAAQIAYFEGVKKALEPMAGGGLDKEVMLSVARSTLHELRDLRSHLSDVSQGQAPYDVIQSQLAQAGQGSDAFSDWDDIARRAEIVPAYLDAARANLRAGAAEGRAVYRGFVEKNGIAAADEAAAFFEKELLEKARAQLSPDAFLILEPRLSAAGAAAAAAYRQQSAFLTAEILPRAAAAYGIGEKEYAWKLKNELGISQSPAELQKKGLALAASITSRMETLAKQVDPSKTLAEVMADLRADHPKDDAELLSAYRAVSERARDFVVAHKIFAIPADYRIDVIETPAAFRSHIGSAAYFPAPPLQPDKKGVFLVTPSGGDAKRLQIHNFAKIPTTVVHEAFPGHDMQFWSFQRAKGLSPVRHLTELAGFSYALNVEGYAHYAEELMRARGFFTPKEELAQLASQLWRAWRIVLDVAVHAQALPLADVAKTLVEKAFQPAALAQVEAHRYALRPTQAITYLLGRLQIEELKAEYRAVMGAAYDEAEFHRLFLSYGPVLPSLIRPHLLARARRSLRGAAAR